MAVPKLKDLRTQEEVDKQCKKHGTVALNKYIATHIRWRLILASLKQASLSFFSNGCYTSSTVYF